MKELVLGNIQEQVEKRTLTEIIITPQHGKRNLSEFHKSVRQLQKDGNYKCVITGRTTNLQVHHIAEFSLANIIDYDKLKSLLLILDPLGYSQKLIEDPITHIDDIRNLLPLAAELHNNVNEKEGNGTGIHNMTFPAWIAQFVCKEDPVPQKGETIETVEERVNNG